MVAVGATTTTTTHCFPHDELHSILSYCMDRVDHSRETSKRCRETETPPATMASAIQNTEGLGFRIVNLEERISSKSSVAFFVPIMRLREILEQSNVIPEEAQLQQLANSLQ